MRDGPDCAELSTLLNEIDVPRYEAVVITDLSTESGTILLNGLPKDAPLTISAYLPARMVTLILSRQAQDSVPPLFEPRIAAGQLLLTWLRSVPMSPVGPVAIRCRTGGPLFAPTRSEHFHFLTALPRRSAQLPFHLDLFPQRRYHPAL
jgi:hypothetical protein